LETQKLAESKRIGKLFLMHEAKECEALKSKTIKNLGETSQSENKNVYNKSKADKIKVKIKKQY
jgi:hypothetical protein